MYNKDSEKLEELKATYQDIVDRLEALTLSGELDEHTRHCIMSASHYVSDYLARNFEAVQKGIGDIMHGQVLDYEAKRIWNAAKAEGWNLGLTEGAISTCIALLQKGLLSLTDAAHQLSMNEAELQKYL